MARVLLLVSIAIVPALARAQAPGSDAPPDGAGSAASSDAASLPPPPAPPPAQPPAAVSPHDACLARRHEIEDAANHAADLDTRTRLLTSLPDCSRPDATLPPAPPTCGTGQQLRGGQCIGGAEEVRGSTVELAAGLTTWSLPNSSAGYSIMNGFSLNVGVGKFVTQDVAMSLRASGSVLVDRAYAWYGVIGPHVQGWFGDGFVGGGLGLGVAIGCSSEPGGNCDATSVSGFDLRAGFRVSSSTTLSFETESLDGFFGTGGALTLASILVGYQSF